MFGLVPYNRRNSGLRKRDGYNDFGDFIDSFFNDAFLSPVLSGFDSFRSELGHMKADIKETEKDFTIDIEIPGVKKEDIKLDLRDDVLSVCVEQKEEVNEEKDNYIRRERKYGSCSRSFYVPDIKHEEISAKYEDGVLNVNLPKIDDVKQKNRQISIE